MGLMLIEGAMIGYAWVNRGLAEVDLTEQARIEALVLGKRRPPLTYL